MHLTVYKSKYFILFYYFQLSCNRKVYFKKSNKLEATKCTAVNFMSTFKSLCWPLTN